jgi:hypothetical protein
LDSLKNIYSHIIFLFCLRGRESFSLENIDEKKHFLYNIDIDGNNPYIDINADKNTEDS